MRERWLQSLWGRQDWRGVRFLTHAGQSIHVLHPGTWNTDQGPDFLHAQLFLDQVFWVGSVEIHVRSSDWYLHQHAQDRNYLPVILHVVWQLDSRYPDLPTLELSRYFSIPQLRESVLRLGDIGFLPCHRIQRPVPTWLWDEWREQLLRDRVERKRSLHFWQSQTGLRSSLARQLGAWINRDVFESIEASIPESLIAEFRNDLLALTALYLGQAGLLQGSSQNPYTNELTRFYNLIKHQHALNPPYRALLWMRQRPAADPGFRLAQLAALVHGGWDDPGCWHSGDHSLLKQSLSQLKMHSFWLQHQNLDGRLANRMAYVSEGVIEGLLINIWSWMPTASEEIIDRWKCFRYENNRMTRLFERLEIQDPTAADSQALLELHHRFCVHRRCGSCALASYWIQDQAPQSI